MLLCGGVAQADPQLQFDVRIADGGNLSTATVHVGETITLQLYATVTGTDNMDNEGFQYAFGSLTSSATSASGGTVGGNFTSSVGLGTNFNGAGSSGGVVGKQNTGDSYTDLIGSTGTSQDGKFISARAGSMQVSTAQGGIGTRIGNSTQFLLGTFTFTVDNATISALNTGNTTIGFNVAHFNPITQREEVYLVDGVNRNDLLNGANQNSFVVNGPGIVLNNGAADLYYHTRETVAPGTDTSLSFNQANASSPAGADTNFNLGNGSASGAVAGAATVVHFDEAGTTSTKIGAYDLNIRGLSFGANATSVTINGAASGPGSTLTLGTAGITVLGGNHTINANVVMGAAQTWSVSTGTSLAMNGQVTGADLNKTGGGTLTLGGAGAANSLTGTAHINGGTLLLAKSGALGTSAVELNGGTLASKRPNSGTLTQANLGALTLSASSTLDLGTGSGGNSSLTFADSSGATWASGQLLTITNWQGNYDGTVGTDHIFFASQGLTVQQLSQIQFFDGTYMHAAVFFGGTDELVAGEVIPEPAAILAGALLVGVIGWRERRRVRSVLLLFSARRQRALHPF